MRRAAWLLIAIAACSSDEPAADGPQSPCVAFAKPAASSPKLVTLSTAVPRGATHVFAANEKTFVVANDGVSLLGDSKPVFVTGPTLDATIVGTDFYVASRIGGGVIIDRFASDFSAKGRSFYTIDNVAPTDTVSLAADGDDLLVATGSTVMRGNALQFTPKVIATGLERAHLEADPVTRTVWVVDQRSDGDRIHRLVDGRDYAKAEPAITLVGIDRPRLTNGKLVFAAGEKARSLAGALVYQTATGLAAIDLYGPSGPTTVRTFEGVTGAVLGRTSAGDLVLSQDSTTSTLEDESDATLPRRLSETKCFDLAAKNGAVTGAVPYDIDVPLWSDAATKERFAVIPSGKKIVVEGDGDFSFPVGTVLVKTFSVDGKRIETRLLVQHGIEDWAGYTYAWQPDGKDAELVAGRRAVPLGGNRSWTIPSRTDCNACHTPAAKYALGPELRQLSRSRDAFAPFLVKDAPTSPLSPLDGTATAEAKARSYLHANCAGCHRDGSATGLAELDLRIDVPLGKTGLCGDPKTVDLGVPGAKIFAAGDPSKSTLALRMRAVDDNRMPKLGSKVVDVAAVKVVEDWIRSTGACN